MNYKTILVHVDDSSRSAVRVAAAAAIAGRNQAHVIGAALSGVSRFLYQTMPPEANDPTLALHLDFLRERARDALAVFTREMDASGIASFEGRLVDDEPGAGISLHGRAADLVIVGQAEPGHALMADFPAYVVIHSGRPVLILPYDIGVSDPGRKILLSWDASREAARALQLALPILAQADSVSVAIFDTRSDSRTVADATAADPVPFLARHGIRADLSIIPLEARRGHRRHEVGEALLTLARERGADMLVMGAYGHSRFRETILGGATRTVLDAMTLPVLMAH
ncbi:universal stress protein [Massilia cavernae]|uniref:Universal stress protein n=1 Tax=Massilia cavernae TaxID=2320864 RepID=A0A418Y4A9_9BURK|nr:universal stress protein [Massilia cavernae]RJG20473.1 universal stress protein [Massilia cavernae]